MIKKCSFIRMGPHRISVRCISNYLIQNKYIPKSDGSDNVKPSMVIYMNDGKTLECSFYNMQEALEAINILDTLLNVYVVADGSMVS